MQLILANEIPEMKLEHQTPCFFTRLFDYGDFELQATSQHISPMR